MTTTAVNQGQASENSGGITSGVSRVSAAATLDNRIRTAFCSGSFTLGLALKPYPGQCLTVVAENGNVTVDAGGTNSILGSATVVTHTAVDYVYDDSTTTWYRRVG